MAIKEDVEDSWVYQYEVIFRCNYPNRADRKKRLDLLESELLKADARIDDLRAKIKALRRLGV